MKTVLLTGGRAPVALEIARLLQKAGYRVLMAESLSRHLSSHSWAVAKHFAVPWPSTQPNEFVQALAHIVETEKVDPILPTCEEIYFIAERIQLLPNSCRVLVPEWSLLHSLHSKWDFVQLAQRHGLSVPDTQLLQSRDDVDQAFHSGNELVFKPVYSRFASLTVVRPKELADLEKVQPTPSFPWVAQSFVSGKQWSTYSLAHNGSLLAHANYPMNFTTGIGPTFAYESKEHPAAIAWVSQLVKAEGFSGQIAFDFIEQENGQVVAIECNPRSTSGLHLFRDRVDLAHALVSPDTYTGDLIVPSPNCRAQHAFPLLLWALGYVRSWKELKRWARMFFCGRDVLLSWRDPMPLLLLGYNLLPLFARGREHKIDLDRAATIDIEWNGSTI